MESVPNTLWDVFTQMDSSDLVGLAAIAMVLICVVAGIIARTAYRMHKNRLEDSLKRELVDRGFSADEVVNILGASAPPHDPHPK